VLYKLLSVLNFVSGPISDAYIKVYINAIIQPRQTITGILISFFIFLVVECVSWL